MHRVTLAGPDDFEGWRDAARALALAADLERRGLLAVAIRPPTVPAGTSRLRIALSAAHCDDDVTQLIEGFAAVLA